MAAKKGTKAAPPPAALVEPSAPAPAASAKAPRVLKAKVYIVLDEKSKKETPVKAKTKSRAIAYVAEAQFKAKIASMDELLELGRSNAEIHDATTEDE